jgi:pimeloyl-ACP methyl ester carboxylesterase
MSTTGRPISWVHRNLRRPIWVLALCFPLLVAGGSGCVSSNYLSVRRVPRNPLADPLHLFSHGGPKPTARTEQVLRRYDLQGILERDPDAVLARLQDELLKEPAAEKMYAFSELAYVQAKKADSQGNPSRALHLYSASVAHAYLYLFAPYLQERNCYDPQFRRACDLYNAGLEGMLRIVNKRGRLSPGEQFAIEIDGRQFDVAVMLKGLWHADDFERFEFVSDYEVKGLVNRHVTYGLGVPLIAVRHKHEGQEAACQFYPERLSFPVTAILRAVEQPSLRPGRASVVSCALELHDPLLSDHVQIADRLVPLETDLTTPLGFFLDNREFKGTKLATWGLLDPNSANRWRGLCMLEAFDPEKIPVLMVHGLWSSPDTWTEMLNELRSLPEVRNRYQFWTYLYPTGQPYWISATELREDLQRVRDTVDPQRRCAALDQMVLVGHSMGGLVSRMQTLESNEDFWRLLSDRPFSELKTDPETRARLERLLFFEPNPAVRRVITIGTPHGGSRFSNDTTQWLGRKLIKLPTMLVQTRMRVIRDNPGFFRNTELLTCNTSIDSLSPESPVLRVLLRAEEAPGVKYNNIVGLIDESSWLRKISNPGDGVVPFESAHLKDAESEIVVEADHVNLHQHPLTILEVRRILLQHSREMYAERGSPSAASPVAYGPPLGVPGGLGEPPSEPAFSATGPTLEESSPMYREAARTAGPQPSLEVR